MQPTEFEDLIAPSPYRPGPMQYIPVYARRKNGQEAVTHVDPPEAITGNTFGISVYQQSMEIAKQIAGFTPRRRTTRARRSARRSTLMASLKDVHRGLPANGVTLSRAQLWDDLEKAQDYPSTVARGRLRADRLSHRVAEGALPGPVHGGAGSLSVMNTSDRVPFYVNACHEMVIEVTRPT